MNTTGIYEKVDLKRTRNITNSTELLSFLRDRIEEDIWISVDLFLYSDDLNSFFFPPNSKGEPDEYYRELFLSLKNSFVNIRKTKDNTEHFIMAMDKGIPNYFELIPLEYKDEFMGFLFLLYNPNKTADKEMKKQAVFIGSVCEEVLFRLTMLQQIEKNDLENVLIREKLIKAENLKLLGEMIGGITHDFNNIFTGVIGYSQLIQMLSDDEDTKDSINEILNAANMGKKKIAFLQETKKIDPSEPPQQVNFTREIKDAARNMDNNIRYMLPGKTWLDVFTFNIEELATRDMLKVQFKQFFMMVFDRFLKAGANKIEVKGEMNNKNISFMISGFKYSRQKEGMPLNLESSTDFPESPILYSLADQLDLKFSVFPGTVKIDLHMSKTDEEPPVITGFENNRVLLFENDEGVLEMFRWIFQRLGIKGEVIKDIDILHEKLNEDLSVYDRIILDISAYPILKNIKLPRNHPPVTISSAWGPLLDMTALEKEMIDRILLKPFNLKDLVRILL